MVPVDPRITLQTLKVLGALLSNTGREVSGAEIGKTAGLASGTLYPILIRLEQARWVRSWWESEDPHQLGRPRRRFYSLTGIGKVKARAAFRELAASNQELAWQY